MCFMLFTSAAISILRKLPSIARMFDVFTEIENVETGHANWISLRHKLFGLCPEPAPSHMFARIGAVGVVSYLVIHIIDCGNNYSVNCYVHTMEIS